MGWRERPIWQVAWTASWVVLAVAASHLRNARGTILDGLLVVCLVLHAALLYRIVPED